MIAEQKIPFTPPRRLRKDYTPRPVPEDYVPPRTPPRRSSVICVGESDEVYSQGGGRAPAITLAPSRAREVPRPPLDLDALRCLSVKDPWITRIGKLVKPYELRPKRTHHRGWLVLCSSLKRAKDRGADKYPDDDGPKGHCLYLANLIDCYPAEPKHAAGASTEPEPGEWVWEFGHVLPILKPFKVSGNLGLWKPDGKIKGAALALVPAVGE